MGERHLGTQLAPARTEHIHLGIRQRQYQIHIFLIAYLFDELHICIRIGRGDGTVEPVHQQRLRYPLTRVDIAAYRLKA